MTPLFSVFMPENVDQAVSQTLHSGFIAEGNKVQEFSARIGGFIGNPRVVMVNSCTMALTIAYKASGVGPGTEVIATPITCVASNIPIKQLGGDIVWADVDPETGMVTAETIEPCITKKTKAICVLHKEGDPAEMDAIYALAKSHGIKVVEDAAHAIGARYHDDLIGSRGDFVCFSFQAIKHITTGDGGALLCGDEEDYLKARKLKWFGIDREKRENKDVWRNDISEWGYKGNMNDIAATIGLAQFDHIDRLLAAFNENGKRYSELLQDVPGITQLKRDPRHFSTYWAYCLLVENREHVISELAENGIHAAQIHPRNDIYSMFNANRRELAGVDYFDPRELCLPCGWWVDANEQERIVDVLKRIVS
jgi:dTDP-4-amino-4,6-dideoxygalactose transaminase